MMDDILDLIATHNRLMVRMRAQHVPQVQIAETAYQIAHNEQVAFSLSQGESSKPLDGHELTYPFPFRHALAAPGMSFICECKKASPSKGLIEPDYDPVAIATEYAQAGAQAVSVLTEPHWFKGSLDDLRRVSTRCGLPALRKDFIVDAYQIYEAKVYGASAVLLICSILNDDDLADFIRLAESLGMDALVEAYEPHEVPRAMEAGARIIGVNNRDLRTFKVDFGRSVEMREMVGPDRVFVSESGVQTAEDVARLAEAKVDAVLIGETLMRAPHKEAALDELRRLV